MGLDVVVDHGRLVYVRKRTVALDVVVDHGRLVYVRKRTVALDVVVFCTFVRIRCKQVPLLVHLRPPDGSTAYRTVVRGIFFHDCELVEVASRRREQRMPGFDGALEDRLRLLVERSRGFELTLAASDDGEVVQRRRDARMLVAVEPPLALQHEGIDLRGLGQVAPALEHGAKVVQRCADFVVILAESVFEDRQRAPQELLRLLVASEPVEDRRERSLVFRDADAAGSRRSCPQLERTPRVTLRRGVVAARVLEPAEVVVQRREVGMLLAAGALDDRDGSHVNGRAVVEAAPELVDHPEAVEGRGGLDRLGAELPLGEREGVREHPLGVGVRATVAGEGSVGAAEREAEPVARQALRDGSDERPRLRELARCVVSAVEVEVRECELEQRVRLDLDGPARGQLGCLARRRLGLDAAAHGSEHDGEPGERVRSRERRRALEDTLGVLVLAELLEHASELEQLLRALSAAELGAFAAIVARRASRKCGRERHAGTGTASSSCVGPTTSKSRV